MWKLEVGSIGQIQLIGFFVESTFYPLNHLAGSMLEFLHPFYRKRNPYIVVLCPGAVAHGDGRMKQSLEWVESSRECEGGREGHLCGTQ